MFYKELYVYDSNRPLKAIIRNYTKNDFDQLIQEQKAQAPRSAPTSAGGPTSEVVL